LRHNIRRVADLSVPVLIRGETGSGKELAARALHLLSPRRTGPFITVNLGAISPSLVSAELFGAERGAFTGSVRRQAGYFMEADGGTLFLDEVGEASAEVQVVLLRALETGEIQPVGAQRPQKPDVRIVAATDADLRAKIADGSFKAPLLHRLAAYELWVPPLRDRRDDFGRLFTRFLRDELSQIGEIDRIRSPPPTGELWLSAAVVARLARCAWPGNVRQLRNAVRQLVIGNRGRARVAIGPDIVRVLDQDLACSPGLRATVSPLSHASVPSPASERRRPTEVGEEELAVALRAARWDLAATATALNISRTSLYALIEESPRVRTATSLLPEEITRVHAECGGDVARMVERLEVSERALRRRLRELGFAEEPSQKGPKRPRRT
jgi:two-component system nitrogen regulation response regulator GlnG